MQRERDRVVAGRGLHRERESEEGGAECEILICLGRVAGGEEQKEAHSTHFTTIYIHSAAREPPKEALSTITGAPTILHQALN